MSEELVIFHCSPTMAGLKTGSLFSCAVKDIGAFYASLRQLNRRLVPRGLRILPLRIQNGRALVYMYRPDRLQADLSHELAIRILSRRQYPVADAHRCLLELMKRLREYTEFPHEIGLFLGYPPEDVCGFIENGAARAKCVGTWKVYGDEESAKKAFARYQKCTQVYCDCFRRHNSFDRLIVAVS